MDRNLRTKAMLRKIGIIFGWLVIIGGAFLAYQNRADIAGYFSLSNLEKVIENTISNLHLERITTDLAQKISAPPPLRRLTGVSGNLTASGVVTETNKQRQLNGNLPALSVNAKLTAAASAKVDDMFKNQYFEHVSPSGRGPGDLAKDQGYEYILIGENLALGNFASDADLVTAWMNSPGHRANILNIHYTEIGVSVKKGLYEGRMTWLAVQEFGRPLSLCPSIDASLKTSIDNMQKIITDLITQIEAKEQEINNYEPKRGAEYNRKIDEYNALFAEYKDLSAKLKDMVTIYNAQVKAFNACLAS